MPMGVIFLTVSALIVFWGFCINTSSEIVQVINMDSRKLKETHSRVLTRSKQLTNQSLVALEMD